MVKGFSQISGIDFSETFALVTQYDSLHLLTALAVLYNLDIVQLNIKSAFTYSPLDKEIWVATPSGLGLDNKVFILKKAYYSLKQAPLQ